MLSCRRKGVTAPVAYVTPLSILFNASEKKSRRVQYRNVCEQTYFYETAIPAGTTGRRAFFMDVKRLPDLAGVCGSACAPTHCGAVFWDFRVSIWSMRALEILQIFFFRSPDDALPHCTMMWHNPAARLRRLAKPGESSVDLEPDLRLRKVRAHSFYPTGMAEHMHSLLVQKLARAASHEPLLRGRSLLFCRIRLGLYTAIVKARRDANSTLEKMP